MSAAFSDSPHSRRDVIKDGLAWSAALIGLPALWRHPGFDPRGALAYLDVARKAGQWLGAVALTDERGARWPADPRDAATVSLDLYNGTPGVVPYWLELYHATKEPDALHLATAGADYLLATLPTDRVEDAGLYTGMAGIGWVLAMTHRATHLDRFNAGARRALDLIAQSAKATEHGAGWADSTDIISGSAGTGLFLLWAHREFGDDRALALARDAGRALVAAGEQAGGGLRWRVNASMARNYPNFSHGTAGVAYFLATLHQATGDPMFLDAALAGARYLQSLATTTEHGGHMVFHSEPGNESLFYLSWCHGPAGTSRLFHRLGQITGDPAYAAYVDALALATVDMKVPERSPGFWNNISQCCGNCGVTEFFISLHALRGRREHLAFAETVAQDTIARGTAAGSGMQWVQAENRVSPDKTVAQTGLMQGAAGVGLAMLHLDGALRGRAPFITLPDNPFA
ncbi:MAG: lanthionine synthetase LanC family protein [Gemmatimonadaceae bacterium]